MRSSLLCSLLLLSCFTLAVQGQDTQDPLSASFDTEQFRGSPLLTRFLNNSVLISVNGESRIEIPADYAEIAASVETVSTSPAGPITDQAAMIRDVSERTAAAMTRVLDILKATPNVTRITTTQVELSPIYNWTSGTQILVGYRAVNSISFRVELASAGSVLDSIVRAGISRIDSVSYAASAKHITAARTRAIQDAIKDARMQAEAMTATIPTTATPEIFRIDMIAASPPPPVQMPMAFARMEGAAARMVSTPQPIVGGNLVIVARVQVRFLVKKETRATY